MLEFDMLMIPIDQNTQSAIQAKIAEGWMLVPGTTPRALYVICRPLQQPMTEHKGFGVLNLDESKMYFVDKDGNKVERH